MLAGKHTRNGSVPNTQDILGLPKTDANGHYSVSTMLLCAWASEHLEREPEVRTVLFASGTILSYIWTAFLPIAAFPASEAPHWRIGSKVYLGFACLATVIFIAIYYGLRLENRRKKSGVRGHRD